jgi:hypothetical protein
MRPRHPKKHIEDAVNYAESRGWRVELRMETEHEFTLILDGISELSQSIVDALFEAGCDDATITKQGGLVSMDFDRIAPTTEEADWSVTIDRDPWPGR